MLKPTLLALALAAASSPALARHVELCDVESNYDLKLTSESLAFTRTSGSPHEVRLQAGRVYVDGREMALTASDRERIARIESEIRALVPEVKAIAKEAVAIAFGAIVHVAHTFADGDADFARSRAKLDEAKRELDRRIEAELDTRTWSEVELEKIIADTVKSTVPVLVGDITGKAIAIALSGDEKAAAELERRASQLEKTLEREVERKAEALEARAKALCPRIAALDKLESDLALRLDGRPLDLIEAR